MCGIRVSYVVLGCIISVVNGITCVKGSQVVSMYHVCYMLTSVVSGYQCCVSCHMWYQSYVIFMWHHVSAFGVRNPNIRFWDTGHYKPMKDPGVSPKDKPTKATFQLPLLTSFSCKLLHSRIPSVTDHQHGAFRCL